MSVKATGLDEALRLLERDMPELANQVAVGVAVDAAKLIAQEARALAPVDSGKLRSSIVGGKNPGDDQSAAVYVKRGGKRDAFYWRFLEYGQGPGGVEHGFFMRARESVIGSRALADQTARKMASLLRRVR